MSDRTFRLILDGKKGGLVKGSTPSSAAKKVGFYTNSVKTGKTSFKFELQETTKDSKKKVYGPYKLSFVKDKIKVKMVGGSNSNSNNNSNIKKIINNTNDNQLLYLLFSTNNNNRKYFNKDKYNKFISFLSKYYSFDEQLKKLMSLRNKSYLQNGSNQEEFDEMRKMLREKIQVNRTAQGATVRTAARTSARTSASASSNAGAKVGEADGKKNLLLRFLENNANLKKI